PALHPVRKYEEGGVIRVDERIFRVLTLLRGSVSRVIRTAFDRVFEVGMPVASSTETEMASPSWGWFTRRQVLEMRGQFSDDPDASLDEVVFYPPVLLRPCSALLPKPLNRGLYLMSNCEAILLCVGQDCPLNTISAVFGSRSVDGVVGGMEFDLSSSPISSLDPHSDTSRVVSRSFFSSSSSEYTEGSLFSQIYDAVEYVVREEAVLRQRMEGHGVNEDAVRRGVSSSLIRNRVEKAWRYRDSLVFFIKHLQRDEQSLLPCMVVVEGSQEWYSVQWRMREDKTNLDRDYSGFLDVVLRSVNARLDAVIQTVEPEFVYEGEYYCWPIPGDSPNIKSAEFPTIEAIDETKEVGDEEYDQSSNAQAMMKGEYDEWIYVYFTHISIPFSSSSPMKGAYICPASYSSDSPPSHLIFTLTSSKGEKISKKYEFPVFEDYHWFFLPVNLPDVVLCEITGKGRDEEYFGIKSLVFISREETPEEIASREAREKLWSEAQVVKSEFVKEGGRDSIPIPRDDPKLVDPSFSMVKCKSNQYSKESEYYDQSSKAQKMLKGEDGVCSSHLSIPFPSPSPMKGAYICVSRNASSPSLLFTFTDCDGKKISKKYEFTKLKHGIEWQFLPIDLYNVVLCEIEGKGMWDENNCRFFWIYSLVFTKIPEEIIVERLSLLPWK
ncbi:hypothetical protein ADUPG1_006748, partial [Aduncisulcus paluster]